VRFKREWRGGQTPPLHIWRRRRNPLPLQAQAGVEGTPLHLEEEEDFTPSRRGGGFHCLSLLKLPEGVERRRREPTRA
jgi:hypothetical protein